MAKFHDITVKNVYKETNDCTVIEFDVPENLKEDFNGDSKISSSATKISASEFKESKKVVLI